MDNNNKISVIKQERKITWTETKETVEAVIKSHDIVISKKDFTIWMGKLPLKGSKSMEEAKAKAISLLVD
jgi:hypothetical protein